MSYTLLLHDADRHVQALRRNRLPRHARAELDWERRQRRIRPAFRLPGLARRPWISTGAGASS
jgi:hypothetical protein